MLDQNPELARRLLRVHNSRKAGEGRHLKLNGTQSSTNLDRTKPAETSLAA